MSTFRTQKAKGLDALHNYGYLNSNIDMQAYELPKFSCFPTRIDNIQFPVFARPCPTVPRHGFVESRTVENVLEMQHIIAQTLREDPNGEVIFMPRCTGKWSGIFTQNGVAFGLGNEGVTSGVNARLVPAWLPFYDFRESFEPQLLRQASVNEVPFVEFVEDEGNLRVVQLRNGPEIPKSRNYIPEPTLVEQVRHVWDGIPLLEWEQMIENAPEGSVVYHPGGALSSHYSVHAITHRIPVIIDGPPPSPGDVLEPSDDQPATLTRDDYEDIKSYLLNRFNNPYPILRYREQRHVAVTAAAVLHAQAAWGNELHLLRLRAEGLYAMLTCMAVAAAGELRHYYMQGPGHCRAPVCAGMVEFSRGDEHQVVNREGMYCRNFSWKIEQSRKIIEAGCVDFKDWDSESYGGRKWQEACELTRDTFGTLDRFMAHPCEAHWNQLIRDWNALLNAVHNGGVVLSKFVSQYGLHVINDAPGHGLMNPLVACTVLDLPFAATSREKAQNYIDHMVRNGCDDEDCEVCNPPEEDDEDIETIEVSFDEVFGTEKAA